MDFGCTSHAIKVCFHWFIYSSYLHIVCKCLRILSSEFKNMLLIPFWVISACTWKQITKVGSQCIQLVMQYQTVCVWDNIDTTFWFTYAAITSSWFWVIKCDQSQPHTPTHACSLACTHTHTHAHTHILSWHTTCSESAVCNMWLETTCSIKPVFFGTAWGADLHGTALLTRVAASLKD